MIFDGDREYIGPYLRYLADQMGLRDWFLYHGRNTPQEEGFTDETAATCTQDGIRKVATICFRDDWPHWEVEKFRHICVHELLHCHFFGILRPLDDMQELIGGLVYAPTHDAMNNALEMCLDGIAYDWGRLLPLPSEWIEQATAPGEAA